MTVTKRKVIFGVSGLILVAALGLAIAGPGSAAGPCGPAGIASAPRNIANIFTINDCVALFKSRPAGEDRTGVTKDAILIGRSSPHTGGMAMFLPTVDANLKMLGAVNQAGGVFGRKIQVIDLDNGGAPARGTDVARQLVEQRKVFAVFANLCVACELATYQYYASKGVPDVFLGQPPVGRRADRQDHVRGRQPGIGDGLVLGRFVGARKPGAKVAVVFQDDAYGQPLLLGFKVGLAETSAQAEIVRTATYNIANSADLSSQAQQAVSGGVDYVAFLGSAAAPFVKALRETAGTRGPW